jgi:hypothetical protein
MKIQFAPTSSLNPNPRNARTHSKKQVSQIANSIKTFSFLVPIVADETSTILAGHGRHAAALMLNLPEVPVVFVSGLSPAKKRALALAENKIAENAGWDREMLATELAELSDILVADDLDISITGFVAAEIDQLSSDLTASPRIQMTSSRFLLQRRRSLASVIFGYWVNIVYFVGTRDRPKAWNV